MRIGFTGSRRGMTPAQFKACVTLFPWNERVFTQHERGCRDLCDPKYDF